MVSRLSGHCVAFRLDAGVALDVLRRSYGRWSAWYHAMARHNKVMLLFASTHLIVHTITFYKLRIYCLERDYELTAPFIANHGLTCDAGPTNQSKDPWSQPIGLGGSVCPKAS